MMLYGKGDPKGWIPSAVTTFVATKALPKSLANLATHLEACPPANVSSTLIQACKEADLDPALLTAVTEAAENTDVSNDEELDVLEERRIAALDARMAALEARLAAEQRARERSQRWLRIASSTVGLLALIGGGVAYYLRRRRPFASL